MGVYVYKIPRKPVMKAYLSTGEKVPIYGSEYAYKPSWGYEGERWSEKHHAKYVSPTDRAWAKALKGAKAPVFFAHGVDSVADVEESIKEGEKVRVYMVTGGSYYDEDLGSEWRPTMGYLEVCAGGWKVELTCEGMKETGIDVP